MALRAKRTKSEFLQHYDLQDGFLLPPEPKTGRPGVVEGVAASGDPVLLRLWPRKTKNDEDLEDIWKQELRHLYRLNGYPGADQYIARVVDAGSDENGFYIAIDAGQRRPLEVVLERGRGNTNWLRSLHLPANRHRLWKNLGRLAKGLEILHSEGMVHRNLDGWSVLTSAGEDPDFQLTGFEWSLRLVTATDTLRRGPSLPLVSFAADWAQLALLAARVFNISADRLANTKLPDFEVHESASAAEIRLLRDLIDPNSAVRVDGERVSARILEITQALDAAKSSLDGRYHLVARLSPESGLTQAILENSGLDLDPDNPEEQLVWMAADIGSVASVVATGHDDGVQLYIKGRELVYRLKQYRGNLDLATWQFAFCEQAEPLAVWRKNVSAQTVVPATSIELVRHSGASALYQRMRGRVPSWSALLDTLGAGPSEVVSREELAHRAVTLLQGIEIAFAAAKMFPVTVRPVDATSGTVELTYRQTIDGEQLSEALKLAPPIQRMTDALEGDDVGEGECWIFSDAARLGQSQGSDVELTYEGKSVGGDQTLLFKFRISGQTPLLASDGYLISAGARGDFVQFRRRTKALRLLKDHRELLQSIASVRPRVMSTHEKPDEDDEFSKLDEAKQQALTELLAVLPVYYLQGPPGVGKTYLVKDLVRRRFKDQIAERLLVTAQGNHALDHLLDELRSLWDGSEAEMPLAVRCRPRDDRAEPGDYDLPQRTRQLFADIVRQPIFDFASGSVATKLKGISGAPEKSASDSAAERRSLEAMILRSANLVFATTNSADLERLLEEKSQFDWAIIEEAGKASGSELMTPLMLSHRRLLIGDHKQLPPFGSREIEELLNDEKAIKNAMAVLPRHIAPTTKNLLEEELFEFLDDDAHDLEVLCSEAKRILYLFETGLTTALDRQQRGAGGRRIASTLKVQHRMHPVICELVSAASYGTLTTSEKRKKEALKQENWLASLDPALLPDKPVVLINMPYERRGVSARRAEQLPPFTNDAEVTQVVRAVANLTVTEHAEKVPSLVILTPYARQVKKLKDAILADEPARLALSKFKPVARNGEWISTVDAFQGNEADVVVFSLVRNNRGATIRSALGFVGDLRRFNVLLSRARQRLIFIGSKEFLETVSKPLGLETEFSSEFLRKFLLCLDQQIASGAAGEIKISAT